MTSALDAFIEKAKAAKKGSGLLVLGQKVYEYDILPASFENRIPCFVGYPKSEYLFISDETPKDMQKAVLAHEVYCADLKHRGYVDHCLMAARDELAFVPAAMVQAYLDMRIRTFEALISLYKDSVEFVRELEASLNFFREMKEQVKPSSKKLQPIGAVEGPKGSVS